MPRIFISYRRSDSHAETGRIYDRLVGAFPPGSVFRDVYDISPGADFRRALERAVGGCDVLLAVIGPNWARAAGPNGRRLDDPGDWVRVEIETALRRGVRVVPVLVSNAALPQPAELPASLEELAYRNAHPVRPDPDFHADVSRLVAALGGSVATAVVEAAPRRPKNPYAAANEASRRRAEHELRRERAGSCGKFVLGLALAGLVVGRVVYDVAIR